MTTTHTFLQLQSLIKQNGELELSLAELPIPVPQANEVLIRVEAAPINPSDLGIMFGEADVSQASQSGTKTRPRITVQMPASSMSSLKARLGVPVPTGNEGAGVVVAAGSSPEAQALMGRTVAVLGRTMYSQYRCVAADQCLVLPKGSKPAEGASAFINPLTALGMIETMRMEGHTALVNTAAASNLGQMLNRICQQDGIKLVNIVRNPEQESLLRSIGAQYVCNSRSPTFMGDLTEALHATGATLAFDAVGGGPLAGQILECMESALIRNAKTYSRYGSTTHKQVYIYGWLEYSQTLLGRSYGMSWGVGGWLLTNFLHKIGPENALRLKQRVAAELNTTFASHYAGEISLAQALDLDTIATYRKTTTGQKYLINPNKDVG